MAKFLRSPGVDPARRERYMAVARRMLELQARLASPVDTVFPDDGHDRALADGGAAALAELARLEAGGVAFVTGSEVGMGKDSSSYLLDGEGVLTPVDEAAHQR